MLSDSVLQLLTAYVDGELSSRQQKLVARLLGKSPEARQLLKDLQENARRVRNLPARRLEPQFADHVLAAVSHSNGRPIARPVVARRVTSRWPRYAVAASILILAVGGVAWFATRESGKTNIAENGKTITPERSVEPEPKPHHLFAENVAVGIAREFGRPVPPDRPGAKVPFDELAKTEWHEHFVEGMTKQHAVHLDVAVTNHRQAVQRLETVLQNKGIRVIVDAPAKAKLADNKRRSEYVIYAENVRPDELAAMLYELGTDERARTSIEALTVSAVNDNDKKQVCELLGITKEELQTPPANPNPFNKFIPKEDVKEPATAATGPSPFAHDIRVAMVLTNEVRGGAASNELRSFLIQRRQLQPGALQIVVVIREA